MTRRSTWLVIGLLSALPAEREAAAAPCTQLQCKLIISPEPIDFGDVPAGTSVTMPTTLLNDSATTIDSWTFTLSGDPAFTFDAPCAPGTTTCVVASTVLNNDYFAPAPIVRCDASLGPHTGVFAVMGDEFMTMVDVTCNGVSSMQSELDYDPPDISLTSAIGVPVSTQLHVRNQGNSTLHFQLGLGAGNPTDWAFSACAVSECTIAPSGPQRTIDVTFTPMGIYDRSVDIILTSDDPDELSQTIPATGTGEAGRITLLVPSPPPLGFGQVPVGIESLKTVLVENTGNAAIVGMTASITAGTGVYAMSSGAPYDLGPGQQLMYSVGCTPDGVGPRPGTLTIDAPGAFPSATFPLDLTCEGINSSIAISPADLSFGRVRVGAAAAPIMVTVTNSDPGTSATLGTATLMPPDPDFPLVGAPAGDVLAPMGGSMTFTAGFSPTTRGPHTSDITGILAGEPARVVHLDGTGVVANYVLVPAVTAIDLGTACLGTQINQTLSLTATEDAVLRVESVALETSSEYTMTMVMPGVVPADLDPTMPGMETATVEIDVAARMGTITDRLVWTTDRTPGDQSSVTLSLTGLDSGLAVSPGILDFGTVATGVVTELDVTTQLCASAGVDVTAVLDGDDAFTLVGEATQPVDGTQSMPWQVRFTAGAPGDYTATLQLTPAGGAMVTLDVRAHVDELTGGDDDGGGLTNYYACGCSGGTGGLGGGLVLLALLGPRRRR